MENTTFVALSRQAVLRRQMDVIANNIANMNTHGYKGEKMMFVDHLVRSRGGDSLLGEKVAYVRDVAQFRDVTPGQMEQTHNPLDLALRGKGYFVVETPDGERYTRDGRFQLDQSGQLVTANGFPVLSDNGQPFFFAPNDGDISIAHDGTVSTSNGPIGRIGVVLFDDEQALKRAAGGLYATDQTATPADDPSVAQGYLESSNIEPVTEMARMIDVNRAYQSVRHFLDREDDRMKKLLDLMQTSA
jgi:flagellar basal-body rod protein FlgF